MTPTPEHVDVLVIGAGLSGVGAACVPPARGAPGPWRMHRNFLRDVCLMRRRPVTDAMRIRRSRPAGAPDATTPTSVADAGVGV